MQYFEPPTLRDFGSGDRIDRLKSDLFSLGTVIKALEKISKGKRTTLMLAEGFNDRNTTELNLELFDYLRQKLLPNEAFESTNELTRNVFEEEKSIKVIIKNNPEAVMALINSLKKDFKRSAGNYQTARKGALNLNRLGSLLEDASFKDSAREFRWFGGFAGSCSGFYIGLAIVTTSVVTSPLAVVALGTVLMGTLSYATSIGIVMGAKALEDAMAMPRLPKTTGPSLN